MFDNSSNGNIGETGTEYDNQERIMEEARYIEENLWVKLERFGKKISFTRDILALVRYLRDKNVSWHRKSIVIGALIYFIVPVDTIPDLSPLVGYLDDLGVITAVLKYMGSEIIPYYSEV